MFFDLALLILLLLSPILLFALFLQINTKSFAKSYTAMIFNIKINKAAMWLKP